jgi:hypothetical protein
VILPGLKCKCGSADIFALKPGIDPVYGVARDLFGKEDKRLPPILIEAGEPDVGTCFGCMPRLAS